MSNRVKQHRLRYDQIERVDRRRLLKEQRKLRRDEQRRYRVPLRAAADHQVPLDWDANARSEK